MEAKKLGRPILFDFGYEGCVWCKKLDATTFREPAVVRQMNDLFVPVKIDAQQDTELTKQLHVDSFPTLIVVAADGKVLARQDDYIDAVRMKQFLQKALAKATASAPKPVAGPPALESAGPPPRTRTAPEKQARAQELLRMARQDYDGLCFMACLERCRVVTSSYPDLDEAEQARLLARKITGDPETWQRACARLSDSLGELYLRRAEELHKRGKVEEAAVDLERVVLLCPESAWARAAREMLGRIRPDASGKAPKPDR